MQQNITWIKDDNMASPGATDLKLLKPQIPQMLMHLLIL